MDVSRSVNRLGQYSSQKHQQPVYTIPISSNNNSTGIAQLSRNSRSRGLSVDYLPVIREEDKVVGLYRNQVENYPFHYQQNLQQLVNLAPVYQQPVSKNQTQVIHAYPGKIPQIKSTNQNNSTTNNINQTLQSLQIQEKQNLNQPIGSVPYQQHVQLPVSTSFAERITIKQPEVYRSEYQNHQQTAVHATKAQNLYPHLKMASNHSNTYIAAQQEQGYHQVTVSRSSPHQGVTIPLNHQQQQQQQQNLLSSSYGSNYSTSPYSPQSTTCSAPPTPQSNIHFIQKSLSDSNINNTLNMTPYMKNSYPDISQLSYQVSSTNQMTSPQHHHVSSHQQELQFNQIPSPQQQEQQFHQIPSPQHQFNDNVVDDGSYYPYHKDLLNVADGSDLESYTVKYNSGIIHQYPAPDYTNQPPTYTGKPIAYYDENNDQCYPPIIAPLYANQQSSPASLPPYSHVVQQQTQQTYLSQPATSQVNYSSSYNHHYNQASTSQPPIISELPPRHMSPSLQSELYLGYRTADLDSPQGSPLPSQQHSQGVFKTPQATPPLHRRCAPARQISKELYSVDSPSNQLLLQDMSLNSPRPRSETVDMEPPVLHPRSPSTKTKQQREADQKAMPPPPAPVYQTVLQTSQQLLQQQEPPTHQRLRSGTVEMTESPSTLGNQKGNELTNQMVPSPTSASLKYTPLSLPAQRSRAGTVEMTDSPQLTLTNELHGAPDRRIRSGTVEMTETHSEPSYYQQQSGVNSQQVTESSKATSGHKTQTNVHANQPPKYVSSSQALPPLPQSPQDVTPPTHLTSLSHQQGQHQQQQPYTRQIPPRSQQQQTVPLGHYSVYSAYPANTTASNVQSHNSNQKGSTTPNIKYECTSPTSSASNPQVYTQLLSPQPHNEVISIKDADVKLQYTQIPNDNRSTLPQYLEKESQKYRATVNQEAASSNVSNQELERQQRAMQQQYVQRVRQAQLQQQLREIQDEYEQNLMLEQDIALEFLLEQKEMVDRNEKNNTQIFTSASPATYQTQQVYSNRLQESNAQLNAAQRGVSHSTLPINCQSYVPSPQQQMTVRPSYVSKDGVFPATGIPLSQYGYQQRLPLQQPQQRQVPPSQQQPIVIMPGGGSFSNPGQFIPRKAPGQQLDSATLSQGLSTKPPTPFQKLRKIAEDISSFVDDVVKFKGKKGDHEYKYLEEMLTQQLLLLDKVAANTSDELRNARKSLVKEVQELLEILERRAANQPDS